MPPPTYTHVLQEVGSQIVGENHYYYYYYYILNTPTRGAVGRGGGGGGAHYITYSNKSLNWYSFVKPKPGTLTSAFAVA